MKNASNSTRTRSHQPWWRIIGVAVFLALTIYFLPIHHQKSSSFLAFSQSDTITADGQQTLTEQLPFGVQLLSFAKAQTTTLELTKKALQAEVVQGFPIIYDLTISNTTATDAQQVRVVDYYPTNTLTPTVIAPSGWFAGDDGTGTYGLWFTSDSVPFYPTPYSLAGNDSDTLRLVVNAASPLPNGTIITNNVYTATATNADTVDGGPAITTRVKAPEFGTLNKTVNPTTVTPGDLLTYTLTLSNSGEYYADDVIITDTIPTHTSYVTSTPAAVIGSNVVTWTIPRIDVGETEVLTLVVQTDPVITNGITIENSSYRASSTNVYTPAVGVDLAPAIVSSQPALTITKTASAPTVEAGNLLTYLITATNQNSATDYARNIEVVDTIPADTVFVDAAFIVGTGTILSPTVGTTGPVTYTVSNPSQLNAGQSVVMSVTVRAKSPLPNGTVITNTYGVSASNIAQPIAGQPVTTTVTSSPQITLSKTVQPQVVLTNQPLEYTVTVTNSGNATAFNVPFTDTLPSSFVPNSVNWTATITGTDLSGTPGVVSFTVSTVSGFTGGQFPNVVTATVEGVTITTGPVATVTVVPEIFKVVKTADHNPVVPGTLLTYTIAITNRTASAQTAIITETYPGEVTFVNADPSPDTPDNNTWSLSVPSFGTRLITITVNVTNPLDNGSAFTNIARVGNLINSLVVQASVTNTVVSTPTLEVSKVGQPSVVEAGELITYTIRYTNSGTMDATNVTINDIYPANTSYVSGGAGNVGKVDGNGGTGSIELTLRVNTPLDNGTTLTNVVSISADQPTTDVYTAFNTVSSAPVLEITKQANPDLVAPGATLTYTLSYTNSGNMNATGVIITDTLSDLVAYSSATNGGSHDGSIYGGVITWNIGPLAGDGGSGSVEVTVVLTSPLTNGISVVNNFEIDSAQGVSDGGTLLTEVNATTDFDLTKAVSPAGTVNAGEQITYTLTAANLGNSNGVATTISDIIPPNTTFVSATPGYDPPAPTAGSPITWSTTLPAGIANQQVYTVVVQINTPLTNSTEITNAATIANTDDSATSNTVTTTVASAATLEITKLADPEPVQAGDTLTYTIQYQNTGTDIANDIIITDTLPVSVTFSNAVTSPDSTPGNQLVWSTLDDLSPTDGVQNIVVTVVVTQPVISGTKIVNQVDISADNATLATNQVTSTINSSPVWEITKTASSDPVTAGAALTYTITYTNVGNANATGVTITDTLDSGVSFETATNGGAETSLGSGVVVWTIPGTVVANGAPGNVQMVVTVAPTQPNSSLLTNNFEIISDQNIAPTADSITTQVQAPVLTVTKTVSPDVDFVLAGDPIEYTITYSNLGPVSSNNIYITDTLPISVTNIVSSSAEATFFSNPTPGVVVWFDDGLGPNISGTITIQGQVITSPWAATGEQITNNVLVSSGGYTATTSVSTEGRPGLPFTITVYGLPPIADVGNNVWITGNVEDAYGNPVYNGTQVDFGSSLAGSSVTTSSVDTVNGSVETFVTSTAVGTTTVTAQTAGPVIGTTVVTFTAGPAVSLELSAISPQTAGVAFPLTVTARDQYGNIATTFTDAITLTDSTGTISGGPVSMVNGTGVANVIITTAGATTITGTNGVLTGITNVVIQVNLADLQLSLVADSPIRLCSTGILTATLTDSNGNPAPSQPISFLYTGNFRPPSGLGTTRNTNSSGVATLTVTRLDGSTIISDVVDAHWTGDPTNVENNASVSTTLTPNPGDVSITVSVSPGSIPADGSATSLLSASVLCGSYAPVDGTQVDFSLAPQLSLSPGSPFTAATSSGVATRTITAGTITGTTTITGSVYSPAIFDTTTLTLLQPAVLAITKTADPASGSPVAPGSIINYTVQVENQGSTIATGVIITDDLDGGVSFVPASGSSNGSFSESAGQIVVTTPSLGIGQSLTASWQVTVTAATSGTLIENYANANSNTTGVITSAIVSHNVVTVPVTIRNIFLPIVIKGCCLPNLVIDYFDVNTASNPPLVTVRVKNNGQASTGSGFWVDLYVDPKQYPDTFNDGDRRWSRTEIDAIRGIAWPINTPLAAGDTVTLFSTGGFDGKQTNWSALPPGSNYRFVTFADSYDAQNNSYVEILESVENTDNQAEVGPISVSGLEVGTSSVRPPQSIPPRRDLGR